MRSVELLKIFFFTIHIVRSASVELCFFVCFLQYTLCFLWRCVLLQYIVIVHSVELRFVTIHTVHSVELRFVKYTRCVLWSCVLLQYTVYVL